MTSRLKPEASVKDGLNSEVVDVKNEGHEILNDEQSSQHKPANSRRSSPSKREIMEELSRKRFPWDE